MTAMKAAPPMAADGHSPERASSRRASPMANMTAISEIAIMTRNSAVRLPSVSGLPTAGGLAGYFQNGIIATETKPAAASKAAVARGPNCPMRP